MKKFLLRALFVILLTAGYHAGFAQSTAAACPKKGTAECPMVAACPKKGTADCPLLKDCPLKGTPDCPLAKAGKPVASNKKRVAKTASADLPPCCRKAG